MSGFDWLRETAAVVGRGLDQINKNLSCSLATQVALSEVRRAASRERLVLESAIANAERQLEIEALLQDDDKRLRYAQKCAEFESLFDTQDGSAAPLTPSIVVPEFPAMPTHEDPSVTTAIIAAYKDIEAERKALLAEAAKKMRVEPRLKSLVEDELTKMGCSHVFTRIP